MKLFSSSAANQVGQMISQTAHELAQRLQPQGVQLLGQGLYRLSLPAARGYVRAKLGGLLRAEIERIDVPANLDAVAFHEGILDRALESLTQLILGAALKQQRLGEQRVAA